MSHLTTHKHCQSSCLRADKALSTTVEIALQISPFYAKQSQSQVGINQLKLFYNKYIRVFGLMVIQTKQSQFKPNKAKNKANSNPIVERVKNDAKCVFTKDYEENVDMGYEKTNPKKPNFTHPKRGKTEVRFLMSEVRYLSSAFFFLNSVFRAGRSRQSAGEQKRHRSAVVYQVSTEKFLVEVLVSQGLFLLGVSLPWLSGIPSE